MTQTFLGRANIGVMRSAGTPGARLRHWLRDAGHHSLMQRAASAAYAIRVVSAAAAYLVQIALARWMGSAEFGIYVYVWTWLLLIGDVVHLGLPLAAQRLIPSYSAANAHDSLRGFIHGAWLLALACSVAGAAAAAIVITAATSWLDPRQIVPLYLACAALPFVMLSIVLDGVARSYNWIGLALAPHFFWRPLLVLAFIGIAFLLKLHASAATAMAMLTVAAAAMALVQLVMIMRRLATVVVAGPRRYEIKSWLSASLPMMLVWGFYTLLTYTDVIVLQQFRPPEDVAHYYGAARTLLLVSFVYFSVAAAAAHRFTSLNLAGDRGALDAFVAGTVRWTFWPSLVATLLILALGWPLLRLFGPGFVDAYPVMFVLAIGLLARASVGPAERLLNMLGAQRSCALVYASAFALNLIGCIVLVPLLGIMGAAAATSSAMILESAALHLIVKHRFDLSVFIFSRNRAKRGESHVS